MNLDVGAEGDIYLDRTPGAYALYAKTNSGWKRWVDTEVPWAVVLNGQPRIGSSDIPISRHTLCGVSFGGVNFKNLESDPGDRPGFAACTKSGQLNRRAPSRTS
ncbi:hypothetical protein R3P38DRAFT_3171023 [Favolaschia claudopus]|uniref:Uncharacterized protein n=1 Tax=Favolaschia claudopus TaxID=2862362 RepID=A0AAW0DRG3_9AGAR